MKPTKKELKIAVKVLKFYNKKIDAFPDEAKDDEQHHDWSMTKSGCKSNFSQCTIMQFNLEIGKLYTAQGFFVLKQLEEIGMVLGMEKS